MVRRSASWRIPELYSHSYIILSGLFILSLCPAYDMTRGMDEMVAWGTWLVLGSTFGAKVWAKRIRSSPNLFRRSRAKDEPGVGA